MPLSEKAPRLSELQELLRRVWTTPEGIDAALASPEGRALRPWIAEQPPISPRERLAVYSDAYFSRLLESLGEDFAAVKRAVGEEDFRRLIADYLAAHPSHSYNISDAGERLAEFAAKHALSKRFPFIADLCRVEWAALRALLTDRLPAPKPDAFALSAEDWRRARLVLDPTLTILACRWNVRAFWEKRLEQADSTHPDEGAYFLAVWRDADWARVEALDEPAWRTLRRLSEGARLAQACDTGTAPEQVQHWFAHWLSREIIKGVEL